jgi:hypothetical protein
VRAVIQKLPTPQHDNLRYLVKFLHRLSQFHDYNKMTPSNLAIVIGPNLLWPPNDDGVSMFNTPLTSLVEFIISNADSLFPGGKLFFCFQAVSFFFVPRRFSDFFIN